MSSRADNGAGTRQRIVDSGLHLFAVQGFRGTTVGQIEEAAGLTPRAGALYKHFESKEALLDAAVEESVSELEAVHSAIELMPLGDLGAELTLLVRWGLRALEQQRDLRRIVIAEGHRFPDLKRRFRDRIVDRAYGEAGTFVRRKIERRELPDLDGDALSVLLTGALLGYTLERDIFERDPAGVEEERFVAALVGACMALASLPRTEPHDG